MAETLRFEPGRCRSFVHTGGAWYAQTPEQRKAVFTRNEVDCIAVTMGWEAGRGINYGFTISWIRDVGIRVSAFSDAWLAFAECADLFAWLATQNCQGRDDLAPEDVVRVLLAMGFADRTPREASR